MKRLFVLLASSAVIVAACTRPGASQSFPVGAAMQMLARPPQPSQVQPPPSAVERPAPSPRSAKARKRTSPPAASPGDEPHYHNRWGGNG